MTKITRLVVVFAVMLFIVFGLTSLLPRVGITEVDSNGSIVISALVFCDGVNDVSFEFRNDAEQEADETKTRFDVRRC